MPGVGFLIAFTLVHGLPANAVSDNVCIGEKCYYPIDSPSYFGDGSEGGLVGMSSASSANGQVVVQESNLCPSNFQGGGLHGMGSNDVGLTPVIRLNGGLYLQWYFPPGLATGLEGTSISYGPSDNLNAPYGPIPQNFPQVTITGLNSNSAYAFIFGQVCYYQLCSCPSGAGNKCSCEFNAAFSEVVINGGGTTCNPTISLMPSNPQPGPTKTSISNIISVTAQLIDNSNSPNCIGGKTIQFSSRPNEMTGGHNHAGPRPAGTFSSADCVTDNSGTCQIQFAASEVAGTETLLANLAESPTIKAMITLSVQVPGLVDISSLTGVLTGTLLRLTGNTTAHPKNHFIQPSNAGYILGIANDIFEQYQATVGFNDMSLSQGGLFDVGPPLGHYWSIPHGLHREGNSVDIDHCALSTVTNNPNAQGDCPSGWVSLSRDDLLTICDQNQGSLINEGPIHCEFH